MSTRGRNDGDANNVDSVGGVGRRFCKSGGQRAEMWLHSRPGAEPAVIRLTFGDGPDLSEAEHVSEINNAKVSAGGIPLDVKPAGRTASRLRCPPAVLRWSPHWRTEGCYFTPANRPSSTWPPTPRSELSDPIRPLTWAWMATRCASSCFHEITGHPSCGLSGGKARGRCGCQDLPRGQA